MIELSGISKRFRGEWVFRGLSLSVPRGASATLVGPSGGGKSVCLKIASGLLEPDEGSVHLGSSRVAMLFQKNALFDSMPVIENLLLPLREGAEPFSGDAVARSRELLREVGLGGTEALYPDELSGGMQKRLGIARALVAKPEIVFYDEPTAGLDPITSRAIADLIRKLQAETGTTFIAVTNDRLRALSLGDRVYLLAEGECILAAEGASSANPVRMSADARVRQFFSGGAPI